jgi:hypothetical protein
LYNGFIKLFDLALIVCGNGGTIDTFFWNHYEYDSHLESVARYTVKRQWGPNELVIWSYL